MLFTFKNTLKSHWLWQDFLSQSCAESWPGNILTREVRETRVLLGDIEPLEALLRASKISAYTLLLNTPKIPFPLCTGFSIRKTFPFPQGTGCVVYRVIYVEKLSVAQKNSVLGSFPFNVVSVL